MPPTKKYSKELLIKTGYEIAQKEGLKAINARRLAKELGSSVQPIFHNFANMEELKEAIFARIYEKYREYMKTSPNDKKRYKKQGLGYIKFARDYPEFFKAIFMKNSNMKADAFIMADSMGEEIIASGQLLTGFTYEKQKEFHIRVWIFTHGIACLIATETITLSDEEISDLLESTVREMMIGFKQGGKNR